MLNNHENLAYGILTVCMWLAFMPKKLVKYDNFLKGGLVRFSKMTRRLLLRYIEKHLGCELLSKT